MKPDASEDGTVDRGAADRETVVRRALGGAVVGAAWIAGLFAAAPLVGGFGLEAVAEGIIARSPGWLSTLAIDLLGFAATPALVAAVIAGVIGAAAAAGVLVTRVAEGEETRSIAEALRARTGTAIATVGVVATVPLFYAVGAELSLAFVVAVAVAVAPPALVARRLPGVERLRGRRGFLRRVGGLAVAGSVPLAGLRVLFGRLGGPEPSERVAEPLERSVSPPSGNSAFDFGGMPAAVTSPADHYVVDVNVNPPVVDLEAWSLDVDGAVAEPYSLAYDDLVGHEESVEQTTTMVCISNEVGGDLIGTAHWTGVQLSDLVAAAGPAEGAVDVVTHAADGYSEAIPMEIVERDDVLIAYGMGDRTLETEHGFPARLLVPGRYGMKMTKWIERIEVSGADHEAYWEERGWDEEAVANTMSYVRAGVREGDRVVVGGVAFGGLETGLEELAGVEVSVDGGETWNEGELEPQVAPHAWRRWRYAFDAPDRTEFDVVVRAVRRDGTVQTEERTGPRPGGSTGWHRMTVEVEPNSG
ncbi:DMSO/TMAO reductase YedYZ, molybdopterin-dependent catalytic subunit [Halorubrum aquaticum]|uniref:DMSO/TMAO reductase YedYZ, molybdopterin-dependent catalytic subunit n=1 Tax=Halorubrum aquaticum TaxID=387340 RepID=A0A1I3CE48_9EURY|nr:molybdopterin-dependent oxidoreductase [Halorubrum aquaticum]SFH72576.1 DMSO/TMAO reductase YedYZ, molybdopterin-dependent catalytic subunit [Halorubrum aquaticum]